MSESLLAKESQPLPPPYTAITSFYGVEIISKSSEYLLFSAEEYNKKELDLQFSLMVGTHSIKTIVIQN